MMGVAKSAKASPSPSRWGETEILSRMAEVGNRLDFAPDVPSPLKGRVGEGLGSLSTSIPASRLARHPLPNPPPPRGRETNVRALSDRRGVSS